MRPPKNCDMVASRLGRVDPLPFILSWRERAETTETSRIVGPIVNRLLFSHDAADASFIDFVIATALEGTTRTARSRSALGRRS